MHQKPLATWHDPALPPQVMCGKRFRIQKPRVQPEIMNVVVAAGQWAATIGLKTQKKT